MNRQELYRQEYRRQRPGWRDSVAIHREAITRGIGTQSRVLDLGCGSGDALGPAYAKAIGVCGLDRDGAALRRSEVIRQKIVGAGERLPFADACFDVVVLTWVLEHLDRPASVFGEIARVLRPGGNVFFLTPNVWNYNVWLIRIVPNWLHGPLTRRLYGRRDGETYAVRYHVNSVTRIDALMRASGLRRQQLVLNDNPTYISFSDALFRLACGVERALDRAFSGAARVHVIGAYRKPSRDSLF